LCVSISLFCSSFLLLMLPLLPSSPLFPYTTLFRSLLHRRRDLLREAGELASLLPRRIPWGLDGRVADLLRLHRLRCDLDRGRGRSEEHTSELQSRVDLVCRLLLEKKKKHTTKNKHK